MKKADYKKILQRIEGYSAATEEIYLQSVEELMRLYRRVDFDPSKPFRFSLYKHISQEQAEIMRDMHSQLYGNIKRGVVAEWGLANDFSDKLAKSFLGSYYADKAFGKYLNRNTDALNAFFSRAGKDGLNLSQNVWKDVSQFKEEMEMAFDIGLRNGYSAPKMAREIKKYLDEPDMLFRRVRDEHGNLHLSEQAKAYHPGQGRYRSSYMNSLRQTSTTINMAYREADWLRWQEMDFVVGYEIKRSSTNRKSCSVCSDLVGLYPKSFKFVGFHPWCRCYMTPILMNMEEFSELRELITEGEDVSEFHSKHEVQDLPDNFTDWVKENQKKILDAKSKPYFIKDNFTAEDIKDLRLIRGK